MNMAVPLAAVVLLAGCADVTTSDTVTVRDNLVINITGPVTVAVQVPAGPVTINQEASDD